MPFFASALESNESRVRNLCFDPENRFVHKDVGWNARMNGLSASLISSQLARIEKLVEMKIKVANQYLLGLQGHPWLNFMPSTVDYSQNVFWVFPILLKDDAPYNAETLQKKLFNFGIETRRFFFPLHMQPVLKNYINTSEAGFEVAERIWNLGIYLPSGLGNTEQEISQVIEILWDITNDI